MSTRAFFRTCWGLLRPHRFLFAFVVVADLFTALVFGAADPLLQKLMIDSLVGRRVGPFVTVLLISVGVGTAARLLGYASAVASQRLKNELCKEVTLRTFDVYYRIPYPRVASRDKGYFVSRVYDEPAAAVALLVDTAGVALRASATFVGALAVALWLSWEVALAVSVVVPALLYISRRFRSRITQAAQQVSEDEAGLREGLGRAVEAYRTVNLFGLLGPVSGRVGSLLDSYLGNLFTRQRHAAAFQATSGIGLSYAETAVLLGAGVQVLRGQLSVGGLFGFTGAYWRVVNSFSSLVAQLPALAELVGHLERMEDFASRAVERPAAPASSPAAGGTVELEGAGFGWEGKRIFDGVDLRVEPGRRVLVTGPNGSGKTTLAHVLTGFLEPDAGRARLPGTAASSALLLPFVFTPGTLKDNVDFERLPEEKRARFLALAERFGLADRLDRDPATLSQGEQRKFQVIMTLLKDADHYVFDEPLSSVDTAGKDAVMEEILEGTRGRGLVVVLHGDERFRAEFDEELELRPSAPPVIHLPLAATA
jgi:ATP-binding cassette, subfamily B, bacterial